jgi:hypothetical protein
MAAITQLGSAAPAIMGMRYGTFTSRNVLNSSGTPGFVVAAPFRNKNIAAPFRNQNIAAPAK